MKGLSRMFKIQVKRGLKPIGLISVLSLVYVAVVDICTVDICTAIFL